eukprot:s648_g5.t1
MAAVGRLTKAHTKRVPKRALSGETLWRAFPEDQLLWVAGGDGLEDGALAVAGECRISCWQVLCLEQLDIAANLKLELPFFANELLGAVHLHGPLGLETILDFCNHLRSILEKAEEQNVCLSCSRRPGAVANSLLLLGAFLILQRGYTASQVMRILDTSTPAIPTVELRFPTPFLATPNFTADSLMLADCLFGLEMALCKDWLLQQTDAERRQIARAYDAIPVFSLLLQGKGTEQEKEEKSATVQFWIAADPVTTVEDPSNREVDTLKIDSPWNDFDLSPGDTFDTFNKGITEPCRDHLHIALRLVKSSEHIHTVDEDGDQSATPMHNYAARSPSKGHVPFITPLLSTKAEHLPTKEQKKIDQPLKRPANLTTFAHFLKQKVCCSLLARANFPDERGLPEGGSYGRFFERSGVSQLDLPFPDGSAPPLSLVSKLIAAVEQLLQSIVLPKDAVKTSESQSQMHSVVVHCKSGLGRSMSLLAALAVAFSPGLTAGAFFGWARLVRPACLQTPSQERFLRSLDEPRVAECNCLSACFGKKKQLPPSTTHSEGSRGTSLRSNRSSNSSILV